MSEVLVLTSTFQPTGKVSVEKAITLMYLGKAYSVKDSDKVLRSPSVSFAIPVAIVVPERRYVKLRETPFSKRAVLKRDGYKCVYCGETTRAKLTMDHVIPRTKFAKIQRERGLHYDVNSFENCVTACLDCNQTKSDKDLNELGWKIPEPKSPLTNMEIDWEAIFS